ncbi:hypothetical protein Gain_0031_139 [Komagataeibacter intermedius TF2]|nr:hypothetical protein Gain_0031_139 [Komagataeibacter intermedius TF2]
MKHPENIKEMSSSKKANIQKFYYLFIDRVCPDIMMADDMTGKGKWVDAGPSGFPGTCERA